MKKNIFNPSKLVKPAGFAHGIRTDGGRLLFLAGQIGVDEKGKITAPDDIAAQFALALTNLECVVIEAGGTASDIVKLTIFITDKRAYLANLKSIGEGYRSVLGRYYPAMTLVEIKSLFDDQALVEIEGMAVIGDLNKE